MSENVKEAIDYFEHEGFIEELSSDKKHYVQILINYAKTKLL